MPDPHKMNQGAFPGARTFVVGSLSGVLLGVGALLSAAYVLGLVCNDRWEWSQYLWWIPTPIALGSVAVCGVASRMLRRRPGRASGFHGGARVVYALGIASMLTSLLFFECRVQGYLGRGVPERGGTGEVGGGVRLFFWNPSVAVRAARMSATARVDADIAIITNTSSMDRWPPFLFVDGVSGDNDAGEITRTHISRYEVASRCPILRFGKVSLGLRGRRSRLASVPESGDARSKEDSARRSAAAAEQASDDGTTDWRTTDHGEAAFIEFDTRESLGRTLVLWLIDMPSDPMLGRTAAMRAAAAAIASWRGPVRGLSDDGEKLTIEAAAPSAGFPEPDAILGDFNTPRRSSSLRAITRDFAGAYEQSGAGRAASFPRSFPIFHIDLLYLSTRLRCVQYQIGDPGDGWHRYQYAELKTTVP